MNDEYAWKDRDDCHGRVIGYDEVRLEQGDGCPADVAALIDVGDPPRPHPNGIDKVIDANPVYKSYVASHTEGVADLDSSAFSWKWLGPDVSVRHPDWPGNYIAHLRELLDGDARCVLVSTHAEVRDALVASGIPFVLVYPSSDLREEYRERMERRGSPRGLIHKVIDDVWDSALAECRAQTGCEHVVLGSGEYLSDFFWMAGGSPS